MFSARKGCWLLVLGCCLLVVGCCLLVVGCCPVVGGMACPVVPGFNVWEDIQLLVVGCWLLVVGCWLLLVVVGGRCQKSLKSGVRIVELSSAVGQKSLKSGVRIFL